MIHSEGDSNKNTFNNSGNLFVVEIGNSWKVVSEDYGDTIDSLLGALDDMESKSDFDY